MILNKKVLSFILDLKLRDLTIPKYQMIIENYNNSQ
jgi:hypothetical protein